MSRALGRYELLRPLARGGMAEVYLARRKAAGVEKMLVVKRIRAERAGDVRFLDLFVREAKLSMSLAHQNIVPVFDFGRIDDQVFLAMERVEGRDLGSTLARAKDRRIPVVVAAFVAAECCQALDYAHRRKSGDGVPLGIVHRDVTPRNVLVSWSGEVKLTDFGIAALAGDATSKLTGTPAYMAPEQARGEPVDARADVYAVGLVLRELLTGERARPGDEREATLAAAKAGTLLPWRGDVPKDLIAIVDRATSPAAADRYPDARAMQRELDELIVAERAAHKGEAPARQLATWLDEVWGDEREEHGADGDVSGDHLVSFLDDGALDVIGTGTERSMAATAAEEEASAAPPARVEPAAKVEVVVPAPAPQRSPRPIIAIVAALAAILGIAGYLLLAGGGEATAPADAAPIAVAPLPVTLDAAPPPIDAAVVVAPPDAAVAVAAPIDAAVLAIASDAGTKRTPKTTSDAGATAEVTPPPTTTQRRVTINATPWAYFTVDNDPTQHETVKTILLPPGPHRIHFSNPVLKIERDVTIEVPADRDTSHVERLGG